MSELRLSSEKRLRIFTGRAFPELAESVSAELGITVTPTSAYDFANGEIFVRFEESVRGSDAFVIQSHAAPVNKQIMEQLIMIDALKRASAKRITVVAPFYGYARQDKKHRGREPDRPRAASRDRVGLRGAGRLAWLETSGSEGLVPGHTRAGSLREGRAAQPGKRARGGSRTRPVAGGGRGVHVGIYAQGGR